MKINTDYLVLMFVITLLLLHIIAIVFYFAGREDIAKEIPVAMIILTLSILTLLKSFRVQRSIKLF